MLGNSNPTLAGDRLKETAIPLLAGEIGSESQVLRRREVIWQAHPRVSAGHFVPDQIRKYG
jgi:hypothetical protein